MNNEVSYSREYIFDNLAGEKEKLEKAIAYSVRESGLQNKIQLVDIKSGPFIFGSKNRCMRIQMDKTAYITISCIDVGNFLYVSIMREEKGGLFANAKRVVNATDIFRQQQQNAMFNAIICCCEKAFKLLEITPV
ncbi:MAG: hypothetical protein IJS67_00650 [Clostridia bacterium]|nr:hypothetical protein [Clostridia bacterium]